MTEHKVPRGKANKRAKQPRKRRMTAKQEKSVYEVRRENLVRLVSERGAKTQFALRMGWTQAMVSHFIARPPRRIIHEDTAREIESKLGLTKGYLEIDHDRPPVQEAPMKADLLTDATRAVLKVAGEMDPPPPREKIADVVLLAYDNAQATGQVSEGHIRLLLRLIR